MLQRLLRVFAADCCPTGLLVQKGLTASLEELPGILAKISFAKSMHWNPEVMFSRSSCWIMCLHGDAVVPFMYAGILR
ncbi:hypothetical protein QUC31_003515 [Theobroma cacao]